MVTKKDTLSQLLAKLRDVGDIDGAIIATKDGLLVASCMPEDVGAETFAAMSATMFGAAETAIAELGRGPTRRVISEADDCTLVAVDAGPKATLVALVKPHANLGLVLLELVKAANTAKTILEK